MMLEIEKLQKTLQKDPSNFQARRELSILLAQNGFNEEALSNLKYLSKYFPEDPQIWYNLGIQYEKVKDFKNAKKAYEKAIEISPQDDFFYNYGETLVELCEWDEAISAFQIVLRNNQNDANSNFNLGLCYFRKEEINLATDYLQKAVELNPQDVFAHFYLGNIYQMNGLTNFAIKSYEKVLEILPDYSWAYFNLASIAYKNGNIDESREYLEKTIFYNPTDIEAYKLLVKIMVAQGNFEDAISLLQTRIKKEESGDLFYILAQVYKKLGEKMEYAYCLKKALENNLTLTFRKDIVKQEFDYASSNVELGKFVIKELEDASFREEDFEPEEVDENEYSEEDDEEDDEFEDDFEDEVEDEE